MKVNINTFEHKNVMRTVLISRPESCTIKVRFQIFMMGKGGH
ncbi:hypothetical protein B4100_2445 [Heyndrickxia coagulans]|nr:hypothetical protein B4100_2445 [Heyndrickxia coagulans]